MTEVLDFRKKGSQDAHRPYLLKRPVFFIGFMGAGKTSVSRRLARMAGVASVDLDAYIERTAGKRISQIFEEEGEGAFRALETQLLEELATGEPLLISCGGGIVLSEENRRILQDLGYNVYLEVTAAEAASRISDLSSRPLFGDLGHAEEVIASRLPLYEEVADLTVDTAGKGTAPVARTIMGELQREGILWRPE